MWCDGSTEQSIRGGALWGALVQGDNGCGVLGREQAPNPNVS